MTDLYWYIETSKVGDDTDSENLDSAMAGNNHLWYGTHTYGVTTQYTIHAILCRCFESRSLNANIYTMLCINSLLLSYIVGKVAEFLVVCFVSGKRGPVGKFLPRNGCSGKKLM